MRIGPDKGPGGVSAGPDESYVWVAVCIWEGLESWRVDSCKIFLKKIPDNG